MNWFQVKAYIKYIFKARYRRGHRIHPPFAFDLVRHLFYEKHSYYHFEVINEIREELAHDHTLVKVTDLGAGSKKFLHNDRKVKDILKYNATPKRQGELISRLVAMFKPQNIIELGTSLGVGTLYLAMPDSASKVFTIEGCPNISVLAGELFKKAGAHNITPISGSFNDELPIVLRQCQSVDMVYFDGHHDYQATLDYFSLCLEKASKSAIFIFDDIYWSRDMAQAWKEVVAHPQVSISFDLFRFGITILNKEVKKQHYMVRWP
ncbi:O-methyltransferase [Plebeiibacterium marinum]|uniref:Class I SAM-dependent methyltransferase n=1 Tax=Plebeiibacterium marinum TaxID=2992111 RepID=A0AAE3MD34_9BACT|nr:class I SAM-dependent methyltransferase [Plebeiobacterium marinum]MCW3805558.1 class I SAM-dependent methyltransferase [Plebeiobacterium marinum]